MTDNPPDNIHNLPEPLTSIVGRSHELEHIDAFLGDAGVRLLTLTGPGGVGKSRLATEAVPRLAQRFPDGIHWIGLDSLTDPASIGARVASAIGLPVETTDDIGDTVKTYFRGRQSLLVLDNFEHLTAASLTIVDWLRACKRLRVLITSRESLRVEGEQELPIAPLAVPATNLASLREIETFDAVRLFVDRARGVVPNFEITHANARTIADICARLDGLPLAIELAAARVKMLEPEQLLSHLGHRLDTLTYGSRSLPDRQRTMRNAIAWSYDLLDPAEQALFRRLSVFAEGFVLPAPEGVVRQAGDFGLNLLDGVSALLDKSLLVEIGPSQRVKRIGMLGVVREFAQERLEESGEGEATKVGLIYLSCAFIDVSEEERRSRHLSQWLDVFEAEHGNLRAAIEIALSLDRPADALYIASGLVSFWDIRGYWSEGASYLERVLLASRGVPEGSRPRYSALLGWWVLHRKVGLPTPAPDAFLEEMKAIGEEYRKTAPSPESLIDRDDWVVALNQDFSRRFLLGKQSIEPDEAANYVQHVLPKLKMAPDNMQKCFALTMIAALVVSLGNRDLASELNLEALDLARRYDEPAREADILESLAQISEVEGDTAQQRSYVESALAIHRALGDQLGIGRMLAASGGISIRELRFSDAAARLRDAISSFRKLNRWSELIVALRSFEELAERLRRDDLAQAFGRHVLLTEESVDSIARRNGGGPDQSRHVPDCTNEDLPTLDVLIDAVFCEASQRASGNSGAKSEGEVRSAHLTRREKEVLRLIVQGKKNDAIAEALFISYKTVSTHVSNILLKLGVSNRAEAAAVAVQHGFLGND